MIRPEYADIEFYFQQIRVHGLTKESKAVLMKEFNNFPVLRQIVADMRKEGALDTEIINYIYRNMEEISDARRSKWKNGEFIKVGRPKKSPEDKYKKPKAERYKTIKDIKAGGTIPIKKLRDINYDDIKNLNTKQAQRYAYYIKENVKKQIRALHRAGYGDEISERYLNKYGGIIKDVRTANVNQLKAFIRRGVAFLRRETSTPAGVRQLRKKVSQSIKAATEGKIDISKYADKPDSNRLFWGTVHTAVDAGYGTLFGKEKYTIMETIDRYLQGRELDNVDLQTMLDSYVMTSLESTGIVFDDVYELRDYLKEKYESQYDE